MDSKKIEARHGDSQNCGEAISAILRVLLLDTKWHVCSVCCPRGICGFEGA